MRYHKSTEICLVSGQSTEPLERVSTTERFGNTNLPAEVSTATPEFEGNLKDSYTTTKED